MRNVIVSEFMSLDGVVQAPGGPDEDRSGGFEHGGWSFQFESAPEGDEFKLDELVASDALLLGRVTYEIFAEYWPSETDEAGYAEQMNSMRKYVVSTTLEEPLEWSNSTLLTGHIADEVATLKQQEGGDILVYGSAQLVQTLLEHDMVDEYRLMVFPIVLGSGKRLFEETSEMTTLRLVDTKTVGGGVVILTYQPADGEEEV